MSLIYKHFFLSLLLIFVSGQVCDTTVCKVPTCLCPSTQIPIPSTMTYDDVPQFIFFTLDDSIKVKQWKNINKLDFILNNPLIKDSFQCFPKPSFYVRQLGI